MVLQKDGKSDESTNDLVNVACREQGNTSDTFFLHKRKKLICKRKGIEKKPAVTVISYV